MFAFCGDLMRFYCRMAGERTSDGRPYRNPQSSTSLASGNPSYLQTLPSPMVTPPLKVEAWTTNGRPYDSTFGRAMLAPTPHPPQAVFSLRLGHILALALLTQFTTKMPFHYLGGPLSLHFFEGEVDCERTANKTVGLSQ